MKITATTLFCLIFFVCCSINEQNQNTGSMIYSEIPDHLEGVENLTVYPADPEPVSSIRFERDRVFENREDQWIGSMPSFTVDDLNRVYIYGSQTIHVFDPDGQYLTALGRSGEGPGELNNFSIVQPLIHSNRLFVYDGSLQRINVYSLDSLEFDYTIPVDQQKWDHIEELNGTNTSQMNYYLQDDETILMKFVQPVSPTNPQPDRVARYYQLNRDGELNPDQIFEHGASFLFSGIGMSGPFTFADPPTPFKISTQMAVSNDGRIFSARTDEFLIRVYSPEGDYLHSFYYPYEQIPVNENIIIDHVVNGFNPEARPRMLQNLRTIDFPETWPALAYMLIDDENRLWVATITEDEEHYEWWVLSEQGELLARFNWPGRRLDRHIEPREIQVIKNGYLYTRELDEEGVASIVRYQIVMEENRSDND